MCRVEFDPWPSELVLLAKSSAGKWHERMRQPVEMPEFEAEALARPETLVHPVDLGRDTRAGGLATSGRRSEGTLAVAAVSRSRDLEGLKLKTWFASAACQGNAVRTFPGERPPRGNASAAACPPRDV